MDYRYIRQLLERYWKGETTLEEEQILRTFFIQKDIPEDMEVYRPLFAYESEEVKTDVLDAAFDERVLASIEEPAKVKAKVVRLPHVLWPLFKAAAVVAIVLSLSMAVQMAMEQEQGQTPNVVTLPPAVVPGAPETAKAGAAEVIPDSLNGPAIETGIPATGN